MQRRLPLAWAAGEGDNQLCREPVLPKVLSTRGETVNDWGMGLIVVLGSTLGGLITLLSKLLIDYRKAADAGQLAIVQAKVDVIQLDAVIARERAFLAEAHVKVCDEERKAVLDRCLILESKIHELQVQVAHDINETLHLVEKHEESAARITKLENGG